MTKRNKDLALKINCEPTKDNCGASCYYQYVYFKAKKRVYTDPKPGDKIIFGTALAKNKIKHIGIVTDVNGKKIKTVEGNKSNQVKACSYTIGAKGSTILSFLRPIYDETVTAAEVVKIAKEQVGYKETGTNHTKYSKELDAIGYYNTKKDPAEADWCAIFTDWCIYEATAEEEAPAESKPKPAPAADPAPEKDKQPEKNSSGSSGDKLGTATDYNKNDAGRYIVTASELNLRIDAGMDKKIVCTMRRGEKVTCYGFGKIDKKGNVWRCVKTGNGKEGYCAAVYLQKIK